MPYEELGTLFGGILIFVAILFASYYFSKKVARMSLKENHSRYMKLHDRIMIGQNRYISIISVGSRYFVIGLSENGMSLIAELNQDDLPAMEDETGPSGGHLNFQEILKNLGRNKDSK